jgi:hypothetical protein
MTKVPEDDPLHFHGKDRLIENAEATGLTTGEIVMMITMAYHKTDPGAAYTLTAAAR